MNNNPNRARTIVTWIVLLAICIAVAAAVSTLYEKKTQKYSDIVGYFKNEEVTEFSITGDTLKYKLKTDTKDTEEREFVLYSTGRFLDQVQEYVDKAMADGVLKDYDIRQAASIPIWVTFIPYLLLFGGLAFFIWFTFRQMSGDRGGAMKFGKIKLRVGDPSKKKLTFADVAGADEEKAELMEVVEFLKNPKKFTDLGARIPRGILMVGPPGTGKTYMAKAAAGEAGVPFFSISGSDFVELYVGVGASRVRDTFEQAKKNAPCIVFIDEIDAVGRQRGAGLGGGNDEREQTLNQLLVEMDGFEENEGVIVVAATNRPDVLDSALLRPGRFDRQIVIHLPDVKAREEILKIHARKKPMAKSVNLKNVAKATAGFAPADLENVLNESALLAARANKKVISMTEITDAIMKVELGVEKKSRIITEKERKLTAYHEAGHAVVAVVADGNAEVNEISIIPRGMAGGYTSYLPVENKSYQSRNEMLDRIAHCMGGRVAEQLCLDDISTGASGDIEQATDLARKMVMRYGMSDRLGAVLFGTGREEVFLGRDFTAESKTYSEKVAALIDDEIKRIIDGQYERAKQILTEHMDQLCRIAEQLLKREKLTGDQFRALLEGKPEEEVFPAEPEETGTENAEAEGVGTEEIADRATDADPAPETEEKLPEEPEANSENPDGRN